MAGKKPYVFLLDLVSVPGLFMSRERNAKWHLRHICPRCPEERRRHRDVYGKGICWWEENWKKGNFSIPKHMGIKNVFRVHAGGETVLDRFKK